MTDRLSPIIKLLTALVALTSQTVKADFQSHATEIVARNDRTCAITDSGVKCWGYLGTELEAPSYLKSTTKIAIGESHACAIIDSRIKCWGNNNYGQINIPQYIANPIQLTAGDIHTCAITGQDVQCWGYNDSRIKVPANLVNPIQIAAGSEHTCALTANSIKCWGYDDSRIDAPTDLANPIQIAAGGGNTCVLTNKEIRCWGYNLSGKVELPLSFTHPTQITVGSYHACALAREGVWCWGHNSEGQLDVPADLVNPTKIAAGDAQTCATTGEGVRCWGNPYNSKVPDELQTFHTMSFRSGLHRVKDSLYAEKKSFLSAILSYPLSYNTPQPAFLFFSLKPFFESLDSEWANKRLRPDLTVVTEFYQQKFRTSSLSHFELLKYLTYSLKILSDTLTSTRGMLTLESQREVSEVLLPALAEKLAKTELTPGDAEDIAALFASHQLALAEMHNTPRLVPFAEMIDELTNWLGGTT